MIMNGTMRGIPVSEHPLLTALKWASRLSILPIVSGVILVFLHVDPTLNIMATVLAAWFALMWWVLERLAVSRMRQMQVQCPRCSNRFSPWD